MQEEVRRFAKTKLKDLEPSRDPRMLCGVITGVRTQLTQRGKILIVTLDDKSAAWSRSRSTTSCSTPTRTSFREDEFLLVVGKVSEDRFNGGLRITAEKAFDIASRAHPVRPQAGNGRGLHDQRRRKLAEILQPYRQQDGLPVSLRVTPQGIPCVVQLGDDWRVAPSDELEATRSSCSWGERSGGRVLIRRKRRPYSVAPAKAGAQVS
jgi:DNA polymerase-3 subunit alpha